MIKSIIKQIPIIAVGLLLIAMAVNMFLGPHSIAAGGVSGIGILVEHAFNIDRAMTVFIINTILLVFALIFLGKETFARIFIGSNLLPLFLAIVPEIKVTDDTMLSVIFGSVLFGVGISLLYGINASSGGTTIPPLIFKKYFKLNTAIGLFVTDLIIVIFNIFVFSFESFLFAILSMVITSMSMNFLETFFNRRKLLMIMSPQFGEIKKDICAQFSKGISIIPTREAHSEKAENILMVIIEDRSYKNVMQLIDDHDPKASVVVSNVAAVHNISFNYRSMDP